MEKKHYGLIIIAIIFTAVFLFVRIQPRKSFYSVYKNFQNKNTQNNQSTAKNNIPQDQIASNDAKQSNQITTGFQAPLDRASERVSKKPFGIYITSQNSPVQPERFQGYHAGTDFEIFPEEVDADVPVKAVCAGKLLIKESASGYGGLAIQSCEAENSPITVIYGHLKLASVSLKTGDAINAGDTIGILGKGNSVETDGERKHLHLGFHKGSVANIRGYMSAKSELSAWLDPCAYVCFN